METTEQIFEWAEGHSAGLTEDMTWHDGAGFKYWKAADPQAKSRIRARVAAALDFLERYTGTDSRWSKSAHEVFNEFSRRYSMESGARAVGDVLAEWIRMVRSGQAKPRLVESFNPSAVSSTDLLEQVRALNGDQAVVPAAPIVLAGAALEIALRAAVEELDLSIPERPSIDTYARELRGAEVLNKQDIKDVVQMAGLRNNAAHGEHELLSRERAGLMEQQVSLFLARLEEAVQEAV